MAKSPCFWVTTVSLRSFGVPVPFSFASRQTRTCSLAEPWHVFAVDAPAHSNGYHSYRSSRRSFVESWLTWQLKHDVLKVSSRSCQSKASVAAVAKMTHGAGRGIVPLFSPYVVGQRQDLQPPAVAGA